MPVTEQREQLVLVVPGVVRPAQLPGPTVQRQGQVVAAQFLEGIPERAQGEDQLRVTVLEVLLGEQFLPHELGPAHFLEGLLRLAELLVALGEGQGEDGPGGVPLRVRPLQEGVGLLEDLQGVPALAPVDAGRPQHTQGGGHFARVADGPQGLQGLAGPAPPPWGSPVARATSALASRHVASRA